MSLATGLTPALETHTAQEHHHMMILLRRGPYVRSDAIQLCMTTSHLQDADACKGRHVLHEQCRRQAVVSQSSEMCSLSLRSQHTARLSRQALAARGQHSMTAGQSTNDQHGRHAQCQQYMCCAGSHGFPTANACSSVHCPESCARPPCHSNSPHSSL